MIFDVRLKRIGALAASLVVVLGLAACGGDGGTAGKSNADLLKEAANNMRALKSYSIDAKVTSAGQETSISGQIDSANKKRNLKISSSGTDIGLISIGDDYWMSQDGGNTFTKLPAEQGAIMGSSFAQFDTMWSTMTDAEIDKAKNSLKDGTPATEKIDNVDTKHMTASMSELSALTASTGTSGAAEGTADLWVDTGKPYIRQMKIDGKSGGEDIKGDFKWGDFDETFDIKAPE